MTNNPLPSELIEVVSDVLKNHDPLHPGDCDDQERLLAAFEQEYQRRIKAAKPKKYDTAGYSTSGGKGPTLHAHNKAIDQYEHNLKQLSEGDNNARSK